MKDWVIYFLVIASLFLIWIIFDSLRDSKKRILKKLSNKIADFFHYHFQA